VALVLLPANTVKTKTLHLTHPQFNYSALNSQSILLDRVDTDIVSAEYHTSLGDLTATEILSIVHKFDSINFVQEQFKPKDGIYEDTVALLTYINHNKEITNFTNTECEVFVENKEIYTRPDAAVLWVFGCSHSYGTGLRDNERRYAELVAEGLGLPLKLIARPGGSMQWTLRHIVNAAIEPRDFVIWQIINPPRTSYFNGKHVEEICFSHTKNRHLLEVYTDEQIYFTHLSTINIGVRYLRAMQSQFMLISLDHNNEYQFRMEYSKYPEYYYCSDFAVDLGTDNLHYGPLSNKQLAITLLNRIQYTNA
jgi:hypothetical protein